MFRGHPENTKYTLIITPKVSDKNMIIVAERERNVDTYQHSVNV